MLAMAFVAFAAAAGGGEPATVAEGKPAPDFTLRDERGKDVKLSAFRAKKAVLLAFYPRDFTAG